MRAPIVIASGIVALVLGVTTAASPAADRSSPGAVVKSFYAYYMQNSWRDHIDDATKPYFTTQLWTLLATALREGRCTHTAEIDFDPFNAAQVGTASYGVGAATVHGDGATVPVKVMLEMGTGRKPFPGSPITISVVRGASGWQIDDVIDQPGGSLAAGLRSSAAMETKRPLTAAEKACLQKPL